MCKYGDQISVRITRHISIDQCLAQEILFLNDQGIRTVACCCGHGDSTLPANIIIWSSDEHKAIAMGYDPQPRESIGIEPDSNTLAIFPRSILTNPSAHDPATDGR